MLVTQKAPRTVDIPLLQYIDTSVDVPVAKDAEKTPQRQHEECMTIYNKIQMDKKLHSAYLRTENKKQNVFDNESRSDLSVTVQKRHRSDSQRSWRRNGDQLPFSGEPVRILGNTSTERFGVETLRTHTRKGAALYVVQR